MTEFHADDYGLFQEQSERILECFENGVLNGTSIIANGLELEQCLQMLPQKGMDICVHLNLLQGECLAPAESVPLLVDYNGRFNASFLKLLIAGLTGKREEYKGQIKAEYRAQINKLLPTFHESNQSLHLDGHAHWHVVPVAFDAMMEVILEDDLSVEYIRIPSEPLGFYFRHLFEIMPFHPINIVKALVLKVLCARDCRKWERELESMERKLFLGVMLSGDFDYRRMSLLLPGAERFAEKKKIGLEILAHPGSVHKQENLCRVTNRDDLEFFTSPAREEEAKAFTQLRQKNKSLVAR